MFEKIKNIFWKKEVSKKGFGEYDSNLWGYAFFWDLSWKKKLSKRELINLFTWYSYVCISAISEWIAGLDRKVFWSENRTDREKQHKYNELITNSFLEEVVGFLQITWIAYIRKIMFWKSIESLEILRTDLVSKRSNWTYDYNINWTIYNYSDEEVFVIKTFSPFKDWFWFSPLEALWSQQSMDEEIINWNWSFFKNGANAWTILQTEQRVEREKKEYIADKWNSEFRGSKNGNKTAVLDQWLKVQNMASVGQKDMDFVNQRLMIRDEIFTIFRVPKVVVWITDWIGYTDRMVWKTTFSEFTLKPITKKIEEALNKNIFKWIWFFRFINIVPIDTEQLAEDYRLWAISLNEYRTKRNYQNIKDWNTNISWEILEYETEWENKKKETPKVANILEKIVKDFVKKDNDKILEKRWEKKIKRTDIYEKKFSAKMKQIFDLQEKNILKKLQEKYKKKDFSFKKEDEEDILPAVLYLIIYQKYFKEIYFDMLKTEGQIAISEVWNYHLNIEEIKKLIWENIKKFATEIDTTTKKEILQIIKDNLGLWNPYIDMEKAIKQRFNQFRKNRVWKIARTETTRAVNKARLEAWKQTGSVKEKEWWTSPDERSCEYCNKLHWHKIKIDWIFAKNDYENIGWPPYHPNCRCDLVPILE